MTLISPDKNKSEINIFGLNEKKYLIFYNNA
jgi:hypothetical protein